MNIRKLILFLASILVLASTGCSTGTPVDWLGTKVSSADWTIKEIHGDKLRLGAIEHRSLSGCRVTFMTSDPLFEAGYPEGWEGEREKTTTDQIDIDEVIVTDSAGDTKMVYYEIFGEKVTGRKDRLAYYQLEWGDDVQKCTSAFKSVLRTVVPAEFPDLPVAQG